VTVTRPPSTKSARIFCIDENRVPKILRISEFHGFTMLNRGGRALGRASAKVKMVFRPA
jgi:hypothetical protein